MNCLIEVMHVACYNELIEKYENPIEHACSLKVGMKFISINGEKPKGICEEAWKSMEEFVKSLSKGKGNFYDGWMKDPMSAMISCNDGFRPVSFLITLTDKENI